MQDNGINSSFVVRATIGGNPVSNVSISWLSSDPSSHFEKFSEVTDVNGLARIWFINGAAGSVSVTASVSNNRQSITKLLVRANEISKTLGRPVIAGFVPNTNINYDAVAVTAKLNTDPIGTYYAFANFSNFYTGVQSVLCNGWEMYEKVCSNDRGNYKGREGHFSVWDGKNSAGITLTPKLVEASSQTKCSPFSHEGSGQMCFVAFDWLPGDTVEIYIQKLSGAPKDYVRLKVTARNKTQGRVQDFAVIDVPGGVNLSTEFAAFNENYLVGSARTCFEVKERSFTIVNVDFISEGKVFKPVRAYGYGNLVAEGQTLCQNYGVESNANGIEIFSGGEGRFVNIKNSLDGKLERQYFRDEHQSKIMIREIPLGTVGSL